MSQTDIPLPLDSLCTNEEDKRDLPIQTMQHRKRFQRKDQCPIAGTIQGYFPLHDSQQHSVLIYNKAGINNSSWPFYLNEF